MREYHVYQTLFCDMSEWRVTSEWDNISNPIPNTIVTVEAENYFDALAQAGVSGNDILTLFLSEANWHGSEILLEWDLITELYTF